MTFRRARYSWSHECSPKAVQLAGDPVECGFAGLLWQAGRASLAKRSGMPAVRSTALMQSRLFAD